MSTSIFGDLSVLVPTDTPFHGTGKIETQESFYITRSSGTARLEATNSSVPLTVTAANAVSLVSSSNSASVTGATGVSATATTGNAALTATVGSVNVTAGAAGTVLVSGQTLQLGPASGTATSVNLQTDAPANSNYTSFSLGATGIHGTTKQDVSLISTKASGSVALETGTSGADTFAKLNVWHDAGNSENGLIELATSTGAGEGKLTVTKNSATLSATTVTLGKAGATINILGDLNVSGTQTVLSSTNVAVTDRIMNLGVMPAASSDSGFIFERYSTDVAASAPVATTTLAAIAAAAATTVTVASATGIAVGQLIKIVGATTEYATITNVAGVILTISPSLAAGLASGSALTAYDKRASAFFYDESAAEFAVGFTTAVPSDTSIGIASGQYANLHCNQLTVDGGFNSAEFRTIQITVPANAAVGAAVLIGALKTRGSYLLVIESVDANGASAVISVSKAQSSLAGPSMAVISSSPAASGSDEQIRASWPASSTGPRLYHAPLRTGSPATNLVYNVRILTC